MEFKFYDFYGTTSQFSFLQKSQHKTNFGGIMSILSLISIILSSIYFGKNFYQRTNPNLIYQRLFEKNQTNFIINNSNIYLAIQIRDDNDKILNITQYFNLQAKYEMWSRSNLEEELFVVKKILDPVNCSEIVEYKKFYVNNTYCFNITNFNFGGYWDGNNINCLAFELNYCLGKKDCKNITDIKNFLKTNPQYLNLYTMKTFVDLNDNQEIIKQNTKVNYFSIDPGLAKLRSLFYSRVNSQLTMEY